MVSPGGETGGGKVIWRARKRAGLSQAELARRLSTSQSLVARWEAGEVEPRFRTVLRAVRACGLDLDLSLYNYDRDHDRLIAQNLRLSPIERVRQMEAWREQASDLQGKARRIDA